MNAQIAAEKWLGAVLGGDAALMALVGSRIYGHTVPPGATYPLVYITLPGTGTNLLNLEGRRIWSEFVYCVRAVGRVQGFAALEAEAAAIERLLSRASGSNDSGEVISSLYQSPFSLVERDKDGAELRHLGGLYRLHVQ